MVIGLSCLYEVYCVPSLPTTFFFHPSKGPLTDRSPSRLEHPNFPANFFMRAGFDFPLFSFSMALPFFSIWGVVFCFVMNCSFVLPPPTGFLFSYAFFCTLRPEFPIFFFFSHFFPRQEGPVRHPGVFWALARSNPTVRT